MSNLFSLVLIFFTSSLGFYKLTLGEVVAVASGRSHNLFLKSDGTLWGMGDNGVHQLGIKFGYTYDTPRQITSSVIKLYSDGGNSIYTQANGFLTQIRKNDNIFGYRSGNIFQNLNFSNVKDVKLGLILKTDGSLFRSYSPTDNNVTTMQFNLLEGSGVNKIASSGQSFFWVKDDGSLWGYGSNNYEQLGPIPGYSRDQPTYWKTPFEILSEGVVDVASRGVHTVILKNDGAMLGMGSSQFGAIGYTSAGFTKEIKHILNEGVASIGVTVVNTFFTKTDGSLWGIGINRGNVLGSGDTEKIYDEPVLIDDGNVTSFSCGGSNGSSLVYIKSDGSLWGVGANQNGQLGLGSTLTIDKPQEIVSANDQNLNTDYISNLTSNWSWFNYPWMYNSILQSWLYLHPANGTHYLWNSKDNSWYTWDKNSKVWGKN